MSDLGEKMLTACAEGGIGQIASAAFAHFNRPIIIYDASYNVLAQLPTAPINEPIWNKLLEQKSAGIDIIKSYYDDKILDKIWSTNDIIYIDWGIAKECPRLAGSITYKGQRLGSIGVFCPERHYLESDIHDLTLVIKALNVELRRTNAYATSAPITEVFFASLFNGNIQTKQDLELWEKDIGLKLSGGFRLMALSMFPQTDMGIVLNILRYRINYLLKNVFTIVHEKSLFIMFTSLRKPQSDHEFEMSQTDLIKTCESYNCSVGISAYFDNLLDINPHIYEAYRTAELRNNLKEKSSLKFYSQYVLSDIANRIMDSIPEKCYTHPAIFTLIESDKTNGTEYLQTLKYYILNGGSPKKTYEQLFIHRNTFSYRLKKIEEITGISFNDPFTYFHLSLSLYLLSDYNDP